LDAGGAELYRSEFAFERIIERLRDHGPTSVPTTSR
jgi:hypothetical protein